MYLVRQSVHFNLFGDDRCSLFFAAYPALRGISIWRSYLALQSMFISDAQI